MKSLFSTVTMLWVAMFLLTSLAHGGASEDLTAFKEVQQAKLDAQKELQQKEVEGLRRDIDAVNKRVDDQLAQVGQAVDRFGVLATCISLSITVLLVLGGFLGYRNAKAEAKEAAISQSEATAKSWFELHAQELQKRIAELSEEAQHVRQQMGESLQVVQAHGSANVAAISESSAAAVSRISSAENDALNRLVELSGSHPTEEQLAAQHTAKTLATELEKAGEDSYSFDDWNARAHAAYAKQEWEQAAYFWRRAAHVPNEKAVNVAQALFNRGFTQGLLEQSVESIKTYDELHTRFSDSTEPELREVIAKALVNKAVALGNQGQGEEELRIYDEVLLRFGDANAPALREQVAKTLMNKSVALGRGQKSEEAIKTCDELLRRIGGATEPELRRQVANALVNKSVAYDQLGQREEAIKTCDELLRRFSDAPEPAVRELVAGALNVQGFARLIEAKQEATRKGAGGLESAPAQALLQMAMANLSQAIERLEQVQKPVNGFILGNRAYVQCLLGHPQQALSDFEAALRAPVLGGQALYDATLKDLDMHPIEQDQVMRDLVEKAWKAFRQEHPPKPPAQ